MKRLSIFILLFLILSSGNTFAQKIHAILFANTLDRQIGADIDLKNIKNQISNLEQYIGYKAQLYEFPGNICKKANLENCLASLSTSSDDIIFFYYSGHGGRYSGYSDPFPFMCLTEELGSNYVPVTRVRELLSMKTARLKIIMTDCCNSSGDEEDRGSYSKGATVFKSSASENFKKLFLNARGEIVVTSSKAGETSGGNAIRGGVFTRNFLSILIDVGNGTVSPDWETVLQKTKQKCISMQTPYWELNTNVVQQNIQPSEPHQNVVISNQPALANAMISLIDLNKKIGEKYRMAENISDNYFTSDAEIVVIGQDMETVVRRKKALTYLQELCATPNIVQVNVLYEENAQNSSKKEFMVVHEVYKQKTY